MSLQMGFLFFLFWGWAAPSQGTFAPGPCVRIGVCTILEMAKRSMTDSHILEELAEAATKNNGNNKAIKGIKGLKVKSIQPPKSDLCFVPDLGMKLMMLSNITIAGKSFIGGSMEITVVSNMVTISKIIVEKGKIIFVVTKCTVDLISCKTNLPSSMLPKIVNKFLNSTLGKVLPGMMCPAADKVVGEMKKKMENIWVPLHIGGRAIITYFLKGAPKITKDHARICFETQITKTNGDVVEIPPEPSASDMIQELDEKKSELTFPVNTLNALMELYKADLDQDVTSDTAEAGPMISCDALKEREPTMEFPENCGELKFKIRCENTPTWSMGEAVAILTISLNIHLVAGPQEDSMFVLTVDLKIVATFVVLDGELHPSLGDASLENLHKISSAVGAFDPESLIGYLLDLLKVTTIPALKKAMEDRIPLPSMMGSGYGDAATETHTNTLRAVVTSECDYSTVASPIKI